MASLRPAEEVLKDQEIKTINGLTSQANTTGTEVHQKNWKCKKDFVVMDMGLQSMLVIREMGFKPVNFLIYILLFSNLHMYIDS